MLGAPPLVAGPCPVVSVPVAVEGWDVSVPLGTSEPSSPTRGRKGSRRPSWAAAAGAIASDATQQTTTTNLGMSRAYARGVRAQSPVGSNICPVPIAEFQDCQLHYRDYGSGDPVVGIMGFAIDQRFWAAQVPAVSATNRFITFDNRGVGRSTGIPPDSIEQMAEDTLRLMDELEIGDAIIFGASMGGTIAQKIALDHPERVKALILAVTFARPIEYMRREQSVAKAIFEKADYDTFLEGSLLHLFSPSFFEMGSETIDRMVRAFYAEGGPDPAGTDMLTAQIDAMAKFDVLDELGRIEVPTLVIGATLDMMVPFFAAEEIAKAIPNARFEALEGGHGIMVEQMQPFNDLVQQFLREVNAG